VFGEQHGLKLAVLVLDFDVDQQALEVLVEFDGFGALGF